MYLCQKKQSSEQLLSKQGLRGRGERERLFGSREREGKLKITFTFSGREREIENATGREGNGKFEARNPGNPGNHIKSKVKFKILFIFMP